MKSSRDVKRLNLELSKRSVDRIEELRCKTDAASATQVIKDALLTYEAIVGHLARGESFWIEDAHGHLAPLDLLIDVPIDQAPRPSMRVVREDGRPTKVEPADLDHVA